MHLPLLSSALLLPYTIAAAGCPAVKPTKCDIAPLENPPVDYNCGTKGALGSPSVLRKSCTATLAACRGQCINTPACTSFGFNSASPGTCTLYNKLVKQMGLTTNTKSTSSFYNRKCFSSSPCPTSTSTPAPTPTPTCADEFYIRAPGFGEDAYLSPSEWSGVEYLTGVRDYIAWKFRINNGTKLLVAGDDSYNDPYEDRSDGSNGFANGGWGAHTYPSSSPKNWVFLAQPTNSSYTNITCSFSGTGGMQLNCTGPPGSGQWSVCKWGMYNEDLASFGSSTDGCTPFTPEVVCPRKCKNGFYLKAVGPGADQSTVGTYIQSIASGTDSYLQLSNNKTLFKLDTTLRDPTLLDTAGNIAIQPKANQGFDRVRMVPANAVPEDDYPLYYCRFRGESLKCYNNYFGDDWVIDAGKYLQLGQGETTNPAVRMTVVCP